MTEALFKSRRDFLAGTAAALTAATVPSAPLIAGTTRHIDGQPALVLFQPHDAQAKAFADECATAGFATLALTDDTVRQWRDGLGRLVQQDDFVLLGLSNWSDYSVLRGLAAEQRRFPRFELRMRKTAAVKGARQIALAIAERAPDWQQLSHSLQSIAAPEGPEPSLFAWMI